MSSYPDFDPAQTPRPRKTGFIFLWIAIGLAVLAILCGAAWLLAGGQVMRVVNRSGTATAAVQSTPPRTDTPMLGQASDAHGYSITVWRLDDPATANRLYSPQSGKRLVAAWVTISNGSSGELFVNPLRFQLVDTGGTVYNESLGSAAGEMQGTRLPGGQSRSGMAGFVLPQNAQVATIRFALKDVYISDGPYISVELTP